MRQNPLVYQEEGKIFHADTCRPLVEAAAAGQLQMVAWGRFNYPGVRIRKHLLPKVNSIGYWDAHLHQEWGLGWHRNEGLELTFLETGMMPFSLEEGNFTLLPDQLTITRPWQPHRVGNPAIGVGKLHWIILDVGVRQPHQEWVWPRWVMLSRDDLAELTKMLRQNEQPIWNANADIKRCFQRIGTVLRNVPSSSTESWINLYINEILIHLLDLFRRGDISLNEALIEGSRTVELFIRYLSTMLSEPWTLESMAAHCKMGTTRFVHYFKQITNMTPMQFLTLNRLEMATRLLVEEPRLSVTDIGYDCGFSSLEYFATVFRKQFGCSPSSYRIDSNQERN